MVLPPDEAGGDSVKADRNIDANTSRLACRVLLMDDSMVVMKLKLGKKRQYNMSESNERSVLLQRNTSIDYLESTTAASSFKSPPDEVGVHEVNSMTSV